MSESELQPFIEYRHRALYIGGAAALVAIITIAEWYFYPELELGFLYLLPVVLAAGSLGLAQIAALSILCALLSKAFAETPWNQITALEIAQPAAVFAIVGILVSEVVHSRGASAQHYRELRDQEGLRKATEQEMYALFATSAAAIFTTDKSGKILLANAAALRLLGFPRQKEESLAGTHISEFLPILSSLYREDLPSQVFRTMIEGTGRRRNGEAFLAQIWISTYETASGSKVAAIVYDASEQLRDREELGLRQLMSSSRVLIGAVSHEIRNLCGAISVVHGNLARVPRLNQNEDFKALGNLVAGLSKLASAELTSPAEDGIGGVDLAEVLDDLKIVIEPDFRDADVKIRWEVATDLPAVRADRQGLVQVFLNLAKNSLRALQESEERLLSVTAYQQKDSVIVRFVDSGPGVRSRDQLFKPFQPGSSSTGLGLYVSRAMVRTFGGELHHLPQANGTCFVVELTSAAARRARTA